MIRTDCQQHVMALLGMLQDVSVAERFILARLPSHALTALKHVPEHGQLSPEAKSQLGFIEKDLNNLLVWASLEHFPSLERQLILDHIDLLVECERAQV